MVTYLSCDFVTLGEIMGGVSVLGAIVLVVAVALSVMFLPVLHYIFWPIMEL
jgi:hypothetical protein